MKVLFLNKERFQTLIIFILLLDLELAMFCKLLVNLYLEEFVLWDCVSFVLNTVCIIVMYRNTKNILKHFYFSLKMKVYK